MMALGLGERRANFMALSDPQASAYGCEERGLSRSSGRRTVIRGAACEEASERKSERSGKRLALLLAFHRQRSRDV